MTGPARPGAPAPVPIAVLAYPGVDELDLFGAYVPLAKAAEHRSGHPGLTVVIAAADAVVRGASGAEVRAGAGLAAVRTAAAVVLPGGRGVHAAARDDRHREAVRAAYRRGARLYAVCSGSFLVAAAGLDAAGVDPRGGPMLATHAGKQAWLAAAAGTGRAVSGLVRDGRVCSIGGVRGRSVKAVDLAFQVLRDLRPDAVEAVAARLETDPAGPARPARDFPAAGRAGTRTRS